MKPYELEVEDADCLPDLVPQMTTGTPSSIAGKGGREGADMSRNEELVASGLRLLRAPLALFVCQGIEKAYGAAWWTEGVLETLVYDKNPTIEDVRRYRKLPAAGTLEECANAVDISVCLLLLTKHWHRIFATSFGPDHRGWAYELIGVRNKNKHLVGTDHASDFTWRSLDTMYRLCDPIDVGTAEEIIRLRSRVDLSVYDQINSAPAGREVPTTEPDRLVTPLTIRTATATAAAERAEARSDSEELKDELAVAGPDFSGADLRKMNFSGANLEGADFTDADLTDANLKGAILSRSIFRNTKLGNANLTDTNLAAAIFEGTTLSITRDATPTSTRTTLVSYGADLSGATLDGATLNFAGADLRSVNFSGANLDGADFTHADLTGANLNGARLRGVGLKGANIKGATTVDVKWV